MEHPFFKQQVKKLHNQSNYTIYHFFQKKDTFKDPTGKEIRVFKMPRFVVPTFIGVSVLAIYFQCSKKETTIKINDQ